MIKINELRIKIKKFQSKKNIKMQKMNNLFLFQTLERQNKDKKV
jgi:hypothetical protein